MRDSALNGVSMDTATHSGDRKVSTGPTGGWQRGRGLPLVTLSAWHSLKLGIPLFPAVHPFCPGCHLLTSTGGLVSRGDSTSAFPVPSSSPALAGPLL